MKRFYSVKELADASGFSVGTIQNRIAEGTVFAIQGTSRGAFRIPASSYLSYLATLGLGPAPTTQMLSESEFEERSARDLHDREIAPVLEAEGYSDMPALLRAVEDDPSLYERYRDVIHIYTAFLERQSMAVG